LPLRGGSELDPKSTTGYPPDDLRENSFTRHALARFSSAAQCRAGSPRLASSPYRALPHPVPTDCFCPRPPFRPCPGFPSRRPSFGSRECKDTGFLVAGLPVGNRRCQRESLLCQLDQKSLPKGVGSGNIFSNPFWGIRPLPCPLCGRRAVRRAIRNGTSALPRVL